METLRGRAQLVCMSGRYCTSFAPETTQPKRNERDQIQTKGQQNQRSQSLSRRS